MNAKKVIAEAAIAGTLAVSALGLGAGVANARHTSTQQHTVRAVAPRPWRVVLVVVLGSLARPLEMTNLETRLPQFGPSSFGLAGRLPFGP